MKLEPHQFCHHCGTQYTDLEWPRQCPDTECNRITYLNPKPVAVLLQPVMGSDGRVGLLVGRRGIAPFIGSMALIGGFFEINENSRVAAQRELLEETGLDIDLSKSTVLDDFNNQWGQVLVAVCNSNIIPERLLANFVENDECTEIGIIYEPTELAFSYHTELVAKWFSVAK